MAFNGLVHALPDTFLTFSLQPTHLSN